VLASFVIVATTSPVSHIHIAAVNAIVLREEMRVRFAQSMSSPIVESIAIVAICVLALIAARQIIDGKLAFDTFVLSLGALAAAGGSLKPIAGFVNDIQAAAAPGRCRRATRKCAP
jgi:ABC-type multidrug transport system fused ATPase/permease subunit